LEQNARRLASTWQELPPVRKGLLAGTGFALAALLFLLYSWSSSSSFVTLYAGLDEADSSEIIVQLQSRGVEYKLRAGGTTISVPEAGIDELRLAFASQGLPEGGHVGFEIFEGNAFTATDFVQRLNFQRGLQGELERTIETFPAVEGARDRLEVHQDRAGHVPPPSRLIEIHVDPLQLQVGVPVVRTRRINAVLVRNHFPEPEGKVHGRARQNTARGYFCKTQ